MRIREVTLSNWRPFYGEQALDLATDESHPMIWIHGNNMRGKTSILNAIRWCLYGKTEDSGRERPIHKNVNKLALQEGDFHTAVRLSFTHNGEEYSLERHVQWDREPVSDAGVDMSVDLRINHQIQSPGGVQQQIRDILHPNISQFYLFDGEMIREFEDRLGADKASGFVRQAVEQILGLPALSLAADDLQALSDKAGMELRRQLKHEKAYQKISEELDGIATALESATEDLQTLITEEQTLQVEQGELEEAQRQYDEIRQLLRERDLLRDEIDHLIEGRERVADRIRSTVRESWWLPAESQITNQLKTAESLLDDQRDRDFQRRHIETRIKELRRSLEERECETCGQEIPDSHFEAVENEIEKLQSELEPLLQMPLDLEASTAAVATLRSFAGSANSSLVKQASEDIARLDLDIYKQRQKVKQIDKDLKESDAKDVADIQRRVERVVAKLGEIRERREKAERLRDALENQQKEKRAQITKLPGKADRARLRTAIYDSIERVYRSSIEQFRDAIRSDVEATASDLFMKFTTEKDFQGVEIDSGYRLTILDKGGSPVAPSAGAQQAIALALIGGLNAAAVREGPLVIDTPFARFDHGHRYNIIKNLPSLGSQIVLLVQPGEFDRDEYLTAFSKDLKREYTVRRVTDQRSEVVDGYLEDALVF